MKRAIVYGVRDEAAQIRVHPPGPGQEDPALGRHNGVAFEQVVEGRAATVARVRTLDRLSELHLIADEDDGLGGGGHRDEVSKRNLTGLVHEEHIARAAKIVPREEPGGPADDR